jgi:hypothetical protein
MLKDKLHTQSLKLGSYKASLVARLKELNYILVGLNL